MHFQNIHHMYAWRKGTARHRKSLFCPGFPSTRPQSLRLFPAAHAHATDTLELVHRELFFSLKWGLMVFFIYFVELSTYQTCKYIIVHVQSTQQNSFMIMMNWDMKNIVTILLIFAVSQTECLLHVGILTEVDSWGRGLGRWTRMGLQQKGKKNS